MNQDLKKYFQSFIFESENFFVTKFLYSEKIEKEFSTCIDIIFNVTGEKNSARGIIAFSKKYGQGKTFFFEVINFMYKRHFGHDFMKMVSAKDLVDVYVSTKKGDDPKTKLLEIISCKNLFIDDIGDEGSNKTFKNYGNELNVIRWVLFKRYELWKSKGAKTFGTTNLTLEEFAKEYDGRLADRILEMTYFREFSFVQNSLRQIEDSRRLTPDEVKKNLELFESRKPKNEIEKIDMVDFFNKFLNEPEDNFHQCDDLFWDMAKSFLIEQNIAKIEEFSPGEELLRDVEVLVRNRTKELKKSQYKHSKADYRKIQIQNALSNITKDDVFNSAQNVLVKQKFLELKKNNFIFKNQNE